MKNILIGGCSFSEYIEGKDYPWISWSRLLSHNTNISIKNTALSSYGQPKISESITTEILKNTYDLVIVQWSGVSRGYKLNEIPYNGKIQALPSIDDILKLVKGISPVHGGVPKEFGHLIHGIKNINYIDYIKRSMIQIYLLQHFLETSNIPYISFWGWEQIDSESLKDESVLKLTNQIYNDNWILNNKNNGFADEFGDGQQTKDLHPNSKCHSDFYQYLKPIIENKLNLKLD